LIIPYQLNKTTIDKYKKHVKLITFPNIFFCSKNLIKLRKKIKITNNFKKCLITLGSIDKERILIKLIKILKKDKFNNITFTVILGKFCAREYQRRIYKNIRGKKNFYIKKFQNDISNQIYNNDLIISSSGITKYEAYFLGKPNIRIYRNVDEKIMDKPFSELQLIKSFIYNDINLSFSKYFFKLYSEKSFMISKFRNNFKKIIKKKIENVNKFYV